MASHSWETEGDVEPIVGGIDQRHSWEQDACDDQASTSDDESDEGLPDHAQQLIDLCLGLYLRRSLTAKDLCTIMWHSSKAGIARATDIAFNPAAPSDHFHKASEFGVTLFECSERLFIRIRHAILRPRYGNRLETHCVVLALALYCCRKFRRQVSGCGYRRQSNPASCRRLTTITLSFVCPRWRDGVVTVNLC